MDERSPIERFCYEEVKRQRDLGDHHAVSNLIDAWFYAIKAWDAMVPWDESNVMPLTVEFIKHLGFLAKPTINAGGFRRYPIRIGWETKEHWGIDSQMDWLVGVYNDGNLNPDQLYLEYEYIHPFGDGNGRTGKILFNWANGTLREPQMPDNPFGWEIP